MIIVNCVNSESALVEWLCPLEFHKTLLFKINIKNKTKKKLHRKTTTTATIPSKTNLLAVCEMIVLVVCEISNKLWTVNVDGIHIVHFFFNRNLCEIKKKPKYSEWDFKNTRKKQYIFLIFPDLGFRVCKYDL